MEASRIDNDALAGLVFGTEENRGGEDPLKGSLDPAVLSPILGEMKIVEQLRWALEVNHAAPLFQAQGGHPNGDEAVLSVGQAKLWVGRDLKDEGAVVSGIDELVCGRPTQWKSAQNKGPGVVRYLLRATVALLAHELDRFELLEAAFGDP